MKTLLVRLSSMGDLIHTLPAIDDVSRARPEVELHWLCEASFADIARLHPFVRHIHTVQWRQWRKQLLHTHTWQTLAQLRRQLKQQHYDKVLDSQGLIKSAAFAKMAGVPIQGLDKYSARESCAAWFYQHTFAVAKGQDAVLRNRLLFAQAFDYELPQPMQFGIHVPEAGRLNHLAKHYHVALHATSRDSKLWSNEYWRTLFQQLYERDGSTIYLPWGNKTEYERAKQLAIQLPFVEVCPALNLLQAAWLLQHAQSIIGVDTGLLHLANALNKPLVGIYTDTDPLKTGVQTSAIARNIGGKGQMPTADDVYCLLINCLTNQN